jgi:PIN domain nuclease of toxin-antitoxin system
VRLLIDTHAFLWEVLDDRRLSVVAQTAWDDPSNELLLSPASIWEIAIKVGRRKLKLNVPVQEFFDTEIARNRLQVLPMTVQHFARVAELLQHHRDPFDRLLVAQALCENVPLLSADVALDPYGVHRIW